MSIKIGKTEISAVADVLMQDWDSAEDAARAVLTTFEEIFEKRAKYVVVGQLAASKERGEIDPCDPDAVKLSLGWYSTEGDAERAARSLWHNTQSGDTFRVWVLDVHHGSPSDLHAERKAYYTKIAIARRSAQDSKIHLDIEREREAAALRASGGRGACKCGHQSWEHSTTGQGRGACVVSGCGCDKWNEKRK